ncbi:hypothetical protein HKX54_16970 [Sulfitobacter sp. M57]|uniref:DUF6473 family protein n=1 Tax=unclassified Sulfitobacter TaxID=196795 RepID=UPI0023E17609|nr:MULTISPECIES: DUF6473 family protein [unclassified Sulfitobacter]MDF3416166.1 hypothetical protein [Sulfitobacter sp. KE5]MDF3423645.1 hypothetical protein [Sulfitobacter sp. KE43]MDF3434712.1 hypothetical protein [Sulfitobacter sp. KE42]MDF3460351.1 hypothetical protein [Sulfitobacter sp. S74]MDF3464249.1 hypothetical protein [Sulfitobacter sp. Ks18]
MTYDVLGAAPLDYLPCRYGASKLLFRGPKRDLKLPYLAFVGATETYGKFLDKPFPALVEETLGVNCANFGQINAGIDAFTADPFVMDAATEAQIAVVQVMGAQNMTNRFYAVHPRRNDRLVSASTLLRTIYREVDFADFHFNKHLLKCLMEVSPERFQTVREELQQAWLARMRLMLKRVAGKSILLWFSDHAPLESGATPDDIGRDPLFVTREMMDEITPLATEVIEVVATDTALAQGTQGMIFDEMDVMAASEMLGPLAHQQAADALIEVIGKLR